MTFEVDAKEREPFRKSSGAAKTNRNVSAMALF
jgi:hypothetical protein